MAHRLARCLNRDYCSAGDKGTVLRLAPDAPFFCPECAHALVPAPDRRSRSRPLWPAAPERLATCPNRDYCTLADQGRVLRLGVAAPFYCPECAHALVRAPDRRRYRRIHWPNVAASIIGGIAIAAAAAVHRPVLPQRMTRQAPEGARFSLLPDPSLASLRSATIGLFPPAETDEPPPRHRRTNGPRIDLASARFAAALQAGLPVTAVLHWHEDRAPQPIAMPWRQALIMAALITPRQQPVHQTNIAPPAPPPALPPGPPPGPLNNAAARFAEPGVRLPFSRPVAPPSAPTEETARSLLAGLLMPLPALTRGRAENPFRVADEAAAPARATPALPKRPLPKSVVPAKHPSQTAAVVPPPKTRAAKAADRKGKLAAPALTAKKPPPPGKIAAAAPAATAPAPPAIHATTDPVVPAPPPARPLTTVQPVTVRATYGPLKDVNFATLPPKFFMSSRPTADKPKKGSLQVDCVIETNGVPSDCHVMNARNAAAVSDALLAWLGSGMVHYTPKTEDGHPVRARQTLNLDFPAEAARDRLASPP